MRKIDLMFAFGLVLYAAQALADHSYFLCCLALFASGTATYRVFPRIPEQQQPAE